MDSILHILTSFHHLLALDETLALKSQCYHLSVALSVYIEKKKIKINIIIEHVFMCIFIEKLNANNNRNSNEEFAKLLLIEMSFASNIETQCSILVLIKREKYAKQKLMDQRKSAFHYRYTLQKRIIFYFFIFLLSGNNDVFRILLMHIWPNTYFDALLIDAFSNGKLFKNAQH